MEIKDTVNYYIEKGLRLGATDLYLLPIAQGYRLFYRYDNQKFFGAYLAADFGERFLVYCKFVADMNVSEKRRGQLGAANFEINGEDIRLRFSTVGDFNNKESLVIRFLPNDEKQQTLCYVLARQFQVLSDSIRKPGLYLFAGSTGAGKTTTMYQLVSQNLADKKQVITIEDPVEIKEERFLQLQVNEAIDLSYSHLLKVCLRHRPDILIVGEIRDEETAKLALRASLTGHHVLATIHGDSSEGILRRLFDLGIKESDFKQTLRGIFFQKLLPITCPFCELARCHVVCSRRKLGVLFDVSLIEQGKIVKQEGWLESLKKAWVLGYIQTASYTQELLLAT